MSAASSPTRQALEGYLAGRVSPERVVRTVVEAYYRGTGGGGEHLRPVVEVIERAAPGVVELASREGGAGFEIRLSERPFPQHHEAELRSAAAAVLQAAWPEPTERRTGMFARLVRAVRRLFTASG